MMNQTQFWLIRHGETDWNVEQRLQGWRDIALNQRGKQQAQSIGTFLKAQNIEFDAVLSSDLQRAVQTAQIIFTESKTPLIQDPQLRERNYGIYEGEPWKKMLQLVDHPAPEINLRDPDLFIPNGESLIVFHDRIVQTFNRIAKERPNQHLAVIAHGGVIDMVWRQLQGLDLTTLSPMHILNASLNHFSIDSQQQWHEIAWGQTDHL